MAGSVAAAAEGVPVPVVESFTPWHQTLGQGEYLTVVYANGVALLALLGSLIASIASFREVGPRYRAAVVARTAIAAIAFLSYIVIVLGVLIGFDARGRQYVPNGTAQLAIVARYVDWTVTVPLLLVELIAVTTLTGVRAARARAVTVPAAVLMILCGFIGGVGIDDGANPQALLVWGGISTVFYVFLYVVVIWCVAQSRGLRGDIARYLRGALVLLLTVWLVYPLAYAVQLAPASDVAVAVRQVAFAGADVLAKVAFGLLLHQVAKLRTAEDVQNGVDQFPEGIWTSQVKRTDAVLPPQVADEVRVPTVFDATSSTPVARRPRS